MRTILAVLVLLPVAACRKNGSSANVSEAAVAASRPAPDANPIDVNTIFHDYQNEAAGDAKHKGKWITFKGSAKFVKKDPNGRFVVGVRLSPGYPHGAEVIFPDSEKDQLALIPTLGKIAPEAGVPDCVFQARCTGRKSDFIARNSFVAESKYFVTFDQGVVVSIGKE